MKYIKYLVLGLLLIPFNVSASEKSYVTKNLEETFAEEEQLYKDSEEPFTYDLSSYTESDNQITIYLFRGKGCGYCKRFLTFLNSIVPEYGKYFKLESYEVWYDNSNSKLLDKVSSFLDEDAGGVPYIIIGDQVFPGYASVYDDSIKQAIVNLYNSTDRYDVFEEMAKAEAEANKSSNGNTITIVIWSCVFTIVGVGISVMYIYRCNQNMEAKLKDMETTLNEIKTLVLNNKEEKPLKEVKKTTTKKAKK